MAIVLTTDGGPHSAETWALASAEALFQSMVPAGKLRPLELQAAEITAARSLKEIYQLVQNHERDRLATTEDVWVAHDVEKYLNNIVSVVQDAVAGTKYGDHFDKSDVVDWIKQVCGQHAIDIQHIERLWHTKNKGVN